MRNRVLMLLFLLVLLFPLLALADSVYIPDRSVSIYVPDNFIPFERHDEYMDSRLIPVFEQLLQSVEFIK